MTIRTGGISIVPGSGVTRRVVEEYVNEAISSIGQVLQAKRQASVRIEEERQRELERQKIRAEELRQKREEAQRFEDLKRLAQRWSYESPFRL
jgi:hypothetical protein